MEMQVTRQHEARPRPARQPAAERIARGLGWFSIGLGLAEAAAPGRVARLIGMGDQAESHPFLRFCGFREMAAGAGILSRTAPGPWMWGRVAGDVMDLASLGAAMRGGKIRRSRMVGATAMVAGITALDLYLSRQLSRGAAAARPVHEVRTVVINQPPKVVYAFWRDIERLPAFMSRLQSVRIEGDRRSRWRAALPTGMTVEWEAEITRDEPGEWIAWRSVAGSDVDIAGAVRFQRATGGRGTVVRVEIDYAPPAGALGARIAQPFGAKPGQQIEAALRQVKQILETGDIVRSDASIHPGMHPARPAAE